MRERLGVFEVFGIKKNSGLRLPTLEFVEDLEDLEEEVDDIHV